MQTTNQIPVTVLTGFLGSGKTTLLNRILTEQHGKRIAVIENEFGEIGIDNELVIGADEEIFEMNNGCICCTVRGDLIRILGNLMKRKDRLDAVLIETTGLADPASVAQTFFVDDDMRAAFRLDAIVTMVDAKHVWQHLDSSSECQEQIAFADVTLINKTDLVEADGLAKLEAKIRSMNAVARIHRTQDAAIALDQILNIRAFDLQNTLATAPDFLKPEMPFEWAGVYQLEAGSHELNFQPGPDPEMNFIAMPLTDTSEASWTAAKAQAVRLFSGESIEKKAGTMVVPGPKLQTLVFGEGKGGTFKLESFQAGPVAVFTQHHPEEFQMTLTRGGKILTPLRSEGFAASHTHDQSVTSVGISERRAVAPEKFNGWLSELLREKSTDIYRMKGIVHLQGSPNRFVFQGVHMLFDGKPDRPWKDSSEPGNQLVFIGRNLNRAELEQGFRACLV
ncbi:MAG: GTP-binding protein [Verrucomicrobia bacterium]|nr:GTP-binding protein [Verrucomicrobiota bacterium]